MTEAMLDGGNGRAAAEIRVVVAGPDGRMGGVMMARLPDHAGISTVAGLRRGESTRGVLADADVLVDFTIADSAVELILTAIDAGVRPVSGTSGLSEEALATIDAAARERGIAAVWASQFTLGGALMMHFCRVAARHLDSASVVESHHATKADAPSGTAWELARQIRAAHGTDLIDYPSAHETVSGVRGGVVGGVRIQSMRMPGVLGWNEVVFAGGDETLSLRQTDATREAFVPFVARAIREVVRPDRVGLIRGYGAVIGLTDELDVQPAASAATTS